MTARLEQRDGVGREAMPLVEYLIGQPLVMEPGRVHRLLHIHPEVDDVQDGVEHGVDDGAPAGASGHHDEMAVLGDDRRRHAGEHSFAGLGEVRRRADQAGLGGQARSGVEVAHLVVEEEAGSGHDDFRAVGLLQCDCQ